MAPSLQRAWTLRRTMPWPLAGDCTCLKVCQLLSRVRQGLWLAAPHPNTAASSIWGAWRQHKARGTCITRSPPPCCLQGSPRLGSALAPQRDPLQQFSHSAAAWAGLPSFTAFSWGGGNKIKHLDRGCWLGAPLGVLLSLRGLEETHMQAAQRPGSVCLQ